jgi:ERCC4-type nuclease
MPRSWRRRRCGSASGAGQRSTSSSIVPGSHARSSSSPRSRGGRRSSGRRRRRPRAANPGGRIPRRRSLAEAVTIIVDTRERYPYRFAQQGAETARATVAAGDYAVHASDGNLLAAVERKSLDNLAATLSDGTLAFQMQRLTELPLAAVVVEAGYAALFKLEHVNGNWLADQLARLEVRYPEVHLVFADSRRYAEDWTYRFLTTALADTHEPSPNR